MEPLPYRLTAVTAPNRTVAVNLSGRGRQGDCKGYESEGAAKRRISCRDLQVECASDFYASTFCSGANVEPHPGWRTFAIILMVDSMDHLLTDPATNAEAEGGRTRSVGV